MTDNQYKIYTKYLERLRLKLIAKYTDLGLRASGEYASALQGEITETRFTMYGAAHSVFMDKGRGTGPADYRKLAPFIRNWIENKDGLPAEFYEKKDSISFAIAHKIATDGIKVPNQFNKGDVVTEVVNDFLANDLQEMSDELGEEFLGLITSGVVEIFNSLAAA